MTITNIFKIVSVCGLDSQLYPRIFFDKDKALDFARHEQKECDQEEDEHIVVYEETPNQDFGSFITTKVYDMRDM